MNQSRSTYQSDYTPVDWLQNNVITNMNEFCSPENVDECLKYISQEFCALGYPSIYSNVIDCPSAVNCDIVKFLNAAFELLRSNNEHIQSKEDLESRNQRLSSDLNIINKKNSQLKNSLEQTERKLANSLEKERQLKEKNDQLTQLLKAEKEETKRLAAQLRQQKVSYQHEYRKYENNINHIKAKINQLLADKTPNKKLASITTSHTLSRNTGQRGKWKTGSAASTAAEDMYNSIIFNYETRCKNMSSELNSFRQCLQSTLLEVLEIVSSLLTNEREGSTSLTSKEFVLNEIKSESTDVQSFQDKFKYLLGVWREIASKGVEEMNKNLEEEVKFLKSRISDYEKVLKKNEESLQTNSSIENLKNTESTSQSMCYEMEKKRLEDEKLAFYKLRENLEKEKTQFAVEKLAMLRLTMQQKITPNPWHQSLNFLPSISVITSRCGDSKVLSSSSSSPDQINRLQASIWESGGQNRNNVFYSKSDTMLLSKDTSSTKSPASFTKDESVTKSPSFPTEDASISSSPVFSPLTPNTDLADSDLPSWAMKQSDGQKEFIDEIQNVTLNESQIISAEEIQLPSELSSEELSLIRLKAAVQDIESRKTNIS